MFRLLASSSTENSVSFILSSTMAMAFLSIAGQGGNGDAAGFDLYLLIEDFLPFYIHFNHFADAEF